MTIFETKKSLILAHSVEFARSKLLESCDSKCFLCENSPVKSDECRNSFEAEFARLNDSDDFDDHVFSSDSGTISDLADPYTHLNSGQILQRSGSFQLKRRHRFTTDDDFDAENSSFESTRELFTPPPGGNRFRS